MVDLLLNAPTIQTIQNRGYVDKKRNSSTGKRNCKAFSRKIWTEKEVLTEKFGGDKNRFVPTDIGEVVNEFLTNNFNEILDYGFTAKVEQDFDDIANGSEKWKETLKHFYA